MKKAIQLIAVFAVTLATLSSCGEKNNKLRIDLADGAVYDTKMSMTMSISSPLMGEVDGQDNVMDFSMEQAVATNEDETYTITNTINKLDVNFAGEEMSFDAESVEGNDTIPAEIGQMFKGSFAFTVDKLGKAIGEMTYTGFPKAMGESLNLNQMGSGMALVFPEEDLTVGYTWTTAQEMNQNGLDFTVELTYTVKEMTGDNVLIEATGPLNGEGLVQGITTTVSGNMGGTYTIDRATGWLKVADYTTNMDMLMVVPGQDELNMNTTIDMLLSSELK